MIGNMRVIKGLYRDNGQGRLPIWSTSSGLNLPERGVRREKHPKLPRCDHAFLRRHILYSFEIPERPGPEDENPQCHLDRLYAHFRAAGDTEPVRASKNMRGSRYGKNNPKTTWRGG